MSVKQSRLFLIISLITCISVYTAYSWYTPTKIEVVKKLSNFEECNPNSDNKFHDGLLYGCLNKKEVYLNYNGNIAFSLPQNIKPLSDFSNKRALVMDIKTNLIGYIDTTGKVVIPCKYKYSSGFSEGIAYVSTDEKSLGAFIDVKGNIITTLTQKYDSDYIFNDGLSIIYDLKTNKQGFINKHGKLVIPCKYKFTRGFSEELALVQNDKNQFGFIDKEGKVVIPFQYKSAGDFSEGLALVQNDKSQFGFIDKKGKLVIPFQYKNAGNFSEDLASVMNTKNQFGFINKKGKLVIPYKNYTRVFDFKDGICLVGIKNKNEDKFCYINRSGNSLTNFNYLVNSGSFNEHHSIAIQNDSTAFILKNN